MNTANKLTLLRVVMIPAFLLVLYLDVPGASYWALAIFVAASLTDTLDGYIARHYNQVTDFGKFMDPLADKCLVVAAMLWFVEIGQMPAWAVLIVVIREFAVSGLRMVAADKGRVIAAGWSGKVKSSFSRIDSLSQTKGIVYPPMSFSVKHTSRRVKSHHSSISPVKSPSDMPVMRTLTKVPAGITPAAVKSTLPSMSGESA